MIIDSEYTKQKRKEKEEFIKELDSILSNKKLSDYEKEKSLEDFFIDNGLMSEEEFRKEVSDE